MNILFVLETFPSYSETFIVNQLYDLHLKGHNIFIYSLHRGAQGVITNTQIRALNKRVWYYDFPQNRLGRIVAGINGVLRMPFRLYGKALLNPMKYYRNPILILNGHVDIVHCHFAPNAVFFDKHFFQKGFFSNAVKVCTFHGYDMVPMMKENYKKSYKNIFDSFDFFTYNTPFLGGIIQECSDKVRAIEMPVGLNFRFLERHYKQNLKPDKFTIVFCGRLINLKGVLLLPKIFALFKESEIDFECIVIGDGSLRGELSQEIERLGLGTQVKMVGAKNQTQVFEFLNRAHVLILPGLQDPATGLAETQGLVIQEAQFFGLPVVISNAGGMRYGMEPNKTGFVVPQNDIPGFRDALLKLYNNKELYNEMSNNARNLVLAKYDISNLNDKLVEEYKNSLSTSS